MFEWNDCYIVNCTACLYYKGGTNVTEYKKCIVYNVVLRSGIKTRIIFDVMNLIKKNKLNGNWIMTQEKRNKTQDINDDHLAVSFATDQK